jgi:HAD superfamily hydrolase (TIGR01509 family)
LIDVFETVLSVDFARHGDELTARAGLDPDPWQAAFLPLLPSLMDGRLTLREGYVAAFGACGLPHDDALLDRLAGHDWDLIVEHSVLHADTVPFLEALRERGVATAFVSNCADNTRDLLAHLGIADLVDVLALSCEVGAAKPTGSIYHHALDALGVTTEAAVFVDDQPIFCDGAVALGIHAVQIERPEMIRRPEHTRPGRHQHPIVLDLREIEALFA